MTFIINKKQLPDKNALMHIIRQKFHEIISSDLKYKELFSIFLKKRLLRYISLARNFK